MFDFHKGEIILIDKEIQWTSFDVVNYLKPAISEFEEKKHGIKTKIKIGHAGTLDPLATGLLIVCTGKKTKEIQNLMNLRKTTPAHFVWAQRRPLLIKNNLLVKHLTYRVLRKR
ncbi:MAG: hypothetical protein KatS3mg028_1468 [Bacteroidia bacterium]|nr:MAG: hypothetical protein KatS3mg028_1468 [Bacteroidia bacterium]